MSYKHIVAQERVFIEAYTLSGKSLSYIARQLKRSKSTINYELARVSPYTAFQAQIDYETKRENCGCKRSLYLEAIDHILTHLKLGWSPESIVKRFTNGRIRRSYPKWTDFSQMTQNEIIEFLLNFNQIPRKVLNYNTSFEIFLNYLPRST
ncbi:MAG TPA: helix-turn-helix domain-containing protein [Paenisporosarcina sp.]|nr:helix-turn-helix domain-containing protein [Paenisporosarcina sp.]